MTYRPSVQRVWTGITADFDTLLDDPAFMAKLHEKLESVKDGSK